MQRQVAAGHGGRAARDGKELWFYNIDLTGWHPEPLRFMYGFGLWQSGATGCIEWAYQSPARPGKEAAVYEQPNAIIYQYPATETESGGPVIAWEAIREGVDDYRYLVTLRAWVERAGRSGKAEAAREADDIWHEVETALNSIDFRACEGSAAQGDWTGKKEFAPDGNRIVSGDHKIANGWTFEDYDALRQRIAEGIVWLKRMLAE